MNLKRAFTFSLVFHAVIFGLLSSGVSIPWPKPEINPLPIQARLVIKKKRNEELLPKKESIVLPPEEPVQEVKPIEDPKPVDIQPEPEKVADLKKLEQAPTPKLGHEKVVPSDKPKPTAKPKRDFAKQLASITKTFAKDVDQKPELFDPDAEASDNVSYFDQVYTLIKASFVVPPHINGPAGEKLQAVVRIFLAADGTLTKLDLESSSGDEHFDKAVMDGTRRVNNFGAVPIFLQTALRERGIVVELCPFKCAKN